MNHIQTIELQLDKVMADLAFDERQMYECNVEYSVTMRAALVRIRRYVWEQLVDRYSFEYPCDWWQHFKQRWFPQWARQRWPVRMQKKTVTVKASYPSLMHPPGHAPVMRIQVISDNPWSEQ